jgi:acetyltransferase
VRRMLDQTKIVVALRGVRGRKPVNMAELEQLIVNFSHLAVEQRWIKEIDINPLLASPEKIVALDARVVLYESNVTEDQLPRPAIRPYPNQYITEWDTTEGMHTVIRPIRPEDEPLMIKFHNALSERSVLFRYLQQMQLSQRVAHERLTRICYIDYDREMALVAERRLPGSEESEILAVGRFRKIRGTRDADCAIVVGDEWQHHGLGSRLMKLLIEIAREEKIERLMAIIHPENQEMQTMCQHLGFKLSTGDPNGLVRAEIELG